MKRYTLTYAILGIIAGLTLPVIAFIVDGVIKQGMPLNWVTILKLHESNPVLYITDTAPIILGVAFWYIGKRKMVFHQRYNQLADISRKSNAQLNANNKKITAFFNSSIDINILIGLDYAIMGFNNAAIHFMTDITVQISLKEGDSIFNYINPIAKPSFVESFKIASEGKVIKFVENNRFFKSTLNKEVWLYIECHPLLDEAGKVEAVSINITDITKRKAIEEAIRLQNKQLKEIARMQSHEMRKPVANIIGLIPLLHPENFHSAEQEMITHLETSAKELDAIIKKVVQQTTRIDHYSTND
jgi:PAS domain-containing protein